MYSLLVNSEPLPVNAIPLCCVSITYCLWALPKNTPWLYHPPTSVWQNFTVHFVLLKKPISCSLLSTSSSNHRRTCFYWEGRGMLNKDDGGPELTLHPKELFGLPLPWDILDGNS